MKARNKEWCMMTFDFCITPGQLTKDHQNADNHWISQNVTFDETDTSGMTNSHSIGDLTDIWLPVK